MAELRIDNEKFVWVGGFADRLLPKEAGFRWNPDRKIWWTDQPKKAAALIKHATPDAAAAINAAMAAKTAALESSRATNTDIDIPCPTGLAYLPYQKAGIAYAMSRQAVLFGDEMGLGKTIQAIGVVNADPSVRRVLILCPASLRLNWKREFEKWSVRPLTVGIADTKKGLPATDVVIVNYDIIHKLTAPVMAIYWDALICDEAQALKNETAKRTKAVYGYWDRKNKVNVPGIQARRRLILTGTPIKNRQVELWTALHYMDPAKWSNFMRFAKRYCGAYQGAYGWDFSGASNQAELQERLRETLMVRRLKADVLAELPDKRRQIITLPEDLMSASLRKATDKVWSSLEAKAGSFEQAVEDLADGGSIAFEEVARVRHETGQAKIGAAIEFLTDAMEDGHKIVAFAHHRDVIAALAEAFQGQCVVLTGETPMAERQAAVDKFQSDPACTLFIGNIIAAGVGITLTAASHVVFVEESYVPADISQAEDRCHRIGQKDSVLVQHLVIDGSIDARMIQTVLAKQAVAYRSLDEAIDLNPADLAEVEAEVERARQAEAEKAARQAAQPVLTQEQIAAIHANLKHLASLDWDRARYQNMAGFNRIDNQFGHDLAARDSLTQRQAMAARVMLGKYRRQLGDDAVAAMWGKEVEHA